MNALLIGGARSGMGVALLLNQKGVDVTLVSNSDFEGRALLQAKGVTVILDDQDMSVVKSYDFVVKNPGIPNDHPLVQKFSGLLNEIDIAARYSPDYEYYAISGTNGKTTTVNMLHAMFLKIDSKALCAGNVGTALSHAVYDSGNFKRLVALEISAFQMEGTPSLKPKVYGLLNLSPDHLDRYQSADDYYHAKLSILPQVDLFIRNIDDKNICRLTQDYKGPHLDLSLNDTSADIALRECEIWFGDVKLFALDDLKVVGKHNVQNAAMAATMAYLAGVSTTDIQEALRAFRGVEHRIEYVDEKHGVRYYNDSKATNPESTEVALQAFDKNVIWLAGGYDKHIAFDILKKYEDRLKKIYVFGESAPQIQALFPQASHVATMEEAIKDAYKEAEKGDIVLLSPACASYDQFNNFEQRGDIFKNIVKTLV